MKKRFIWYSILIIVLILLDQGTKLIISNFYTVKDGILLVSNTVHIHPILNDRCVLEYTQIAEKTSIPLFVWLFLDPLKAAVSFFVPIMIAMLFRKFFFWDKSVKKYSLLTGIMICFILSACLCHILGDFIGGGSLDFICFSWDDTIVINGVLQNIVRHKSFDLKDFYIYIGMILLCVRGIIELFIYMKNKDVIADRLRHPIQNMKTIKQQSKQ